LPVRQDGSPAAGLARPEDGLPAARGDSAPQVRAGLAAFADDSVQPAACSGERAPDGFVRLVRRVDSAEPLPVCFALLVRDDSAAFADDSVPLAEAVDSAALEPPGLADLREPLAEREAGLPLAD
jgi:hypothetical protein